MDEEQTPIEIIFHSAIIDSIRTTKDGGWKITFDVHDRDTEMVKKLADLRMATLTIPIIVESNGYTGVDTESI